MHELRFLFSDVDLALGYFTVSRMPFRGDRGRRDGHGAGLAQPEDSMGSGSAQGQDQDQGVTQEQFAQLMAMMAQVVQALVPPVRALPPPPPPHSESEQHSWADPHDQRRDQTEQIVPLE